MELLVVIAVIAILAALLVPALARGKAHGRRAYCINNFRQLQLAWQMYIDDHNGHLPYNTITLGAGEDPGFPNWVAGWIALDNDWKDNTNTTKLVSGFGGIGMYLGDPRVYKCPEDFLKTKIGGNFYPRVRSIQMNYYMGHQIGVVPSTSIDSIYQNIDYLAAHSPLETGCVMIDTHEDSMGMGAFIVSSPFDEWWNSVPASRHNGGATVSFSDGHVVCHRWLDPRTSIPVSQTNHVYGLNQPGNRDIRWLEERATVRRLLAF